MCFHSLQTGKHIASRTCWTPSLRKICCRFHSLQTGKRMASDENLFTGFTNIMFPFPSNGKVHRKSSVGWYLLLLSLVSIPFKRESASQGTATRWTPREISIVFPFPSNGKVHRKNTILQTLQQMTESFHSLQTGKPIARWKRSIRKGYDCVVSIPFKRESLSQVNRRSWAVPQYQVFPFPSNGKAYRKSSVVG